MKLADASLVSLPRYSLVADEDDKKPNKQMYSLAELPSHYERTGVCVCGGGVRDRQTDRRERSKGFRKRDTGIDRQRDRRGIKTGRRREG